MKLNWQNFLVQAFPAVLVLVAGWTVLAVVRAGLEKSRAVARVEPGSVWLYSRNSENPFAKEPRSISTNYVIALSNGWVKYRCVFEGRDHGFDTSMRVRLFVVDSTRLYPAP